jgi:hypothetical protein
LISVSLDRSVEYGHRGDVAVALDGYPASGEYPMRKLSFAPPCRLVVLALGLAGAAGCGSKMYPVQGKVIFKDGRALSGGQVIFEPEDKEANFSARGDIQADGTFRMGTHTDDDGVPAGTYRAVVMPKPPPNPDQRPRPPPPIHPRFQSFDKSGLKYTVPGDPKLTIEVDKP